MSSKLVSTAVEFSAQAGGSCADKIARQFSQAASQYQHHDLLQRQSAARLLTKITPQGRLLDLGCGPGTAFEDSSNNTQVIGLDIAPGMLSQMQERFPHYGALCADAQALPLQDACIDTLYSNLALQWCRDFDSVVTELTRVVRAEGQCHLAIVVDGSLPELQSLGLRVNPFAEPDSLLSCFDEENWQVESGVVESLQVHFDELKSLLYSIKGVGASAAVDGAAQQTQSQLRGRKDWQALKAIAEGLRQPQGIPLTYKILFIHASRKG